MERKRTTVLSEIKYILEPPQVPSSHKKNSVALVTTTGSHCTVAMHTQRSSCSSLKCHITSSRLNSGGCCSSSGMGKLLHKKKRKNNHTLGRNKMLSRKIAQTKLRGSRALSVRNGASAKKHRNLHCCFQDEGTCQYLGFVHHPPWLQMERKQKHTNLNMFKESLHERR